MDVAADLEQVRSLDAMWRAFRASPSSAQTLVELRTSVVPALFAIGLGGIPNALGGIIAQPYLCRLDA
jgi:hypothetical protein